MVETEERSPSVAAIVMTANEVENIGKCIQSLSALNKVFVLDSASTDGTIESAITFTNALVVQVPWLGYAKTFNYGVTLAADYDWILRIDADEELAGDIRAVINDAPPAVDGIVVRRPVYFLDQPLRRGPHAKLKMLRLFRSARGRCEETSADEHIIVSGKVMFEPRIEVIDRDKKPFGRWLEKHIRWARKEAANRRVTQTQLTDIDPFNRRKRFLKFNIYYAMPPFVRAFLYFLYRFLFCLECLGGKSNVIWCILQALWYRLLVDVYILCPQLLDEE